MDTSLPPADELVLVDRELAQLDARRTQLLARRAWLIRALYPPVAAAARPWAGSGRTVTPSASSGNIR
ncbi:hypothetical protein AB0B13_33225 [Streptomyces sp. NPDC042898]|uniref:hypothetical protein n=1 Tax=Streptomyces sp. NPDC042898 TaxID=3154334 RepID=UPI0033FCB52A